MAASHNLAADASAAEVNNFLATLTTQHPSIVVVPREITSATPASLTQEWGPQLRSSYLAATNAAALTRQTGTLMLVATRPNIVWAHTAAARHNGDNLSADKLEALRVDHYNGGTDWHCVGIVVCHRTVSCLDCPLPFPPLPPSPRLSAAAPPVSWHLHQTLTPEADVHI